MNRDRTISSACQTMGRLFLIVLMLCNSTAWSYTVSGKTYNTSGSEEDVQRTIIRAPEGAIIVIPNGSYTWDRQIVTDKKAVHIMAQSLGGVTITRAGRRGVQLNVFSINRKDSIPCQTAYPAARQTGQGWSGSSKAPYGNASG
jgi:hypothetical protein